MMSSAWKLQVRQTRAASESVKTTSRSCWTLRASISCGLRVLRVRLILMFPSGWLGFWREPQFFGKAHRVLNDLGVVYSLLPSGGDAPRMENRGKRKQG